MPITNLPDDELIQAGLRVNTGRLLQQTGYTLALVRSEPEVLALLPSGFDQEVETAAGEVKKGIEDTTVARFESKRSTSAQGESLHGLKAWARKAAAFGKGLARDGVEVPRELLVVGPAKSAISLIHEDALRKAGLLESLGLDGFWRDRAAALAAEGRRRAAELGTASATQDLLQGGLPEAVRRHSRHEGIVYTGLKRINYAGQEYHAGEPARAARYNLSLLHPPRKGRDKGEAGGPAGTEPQTADTPG
jgi:hypothetical protein